jgi:hypothetical protein
MASPKFPAPMIARRLLLLLLAAVVVAVARDILLWLVAGGWWLDDEGGKGISIPVSIALACECFVLIIPNLKSGGGPPLALGLIACIVIQIGGPNQRSFAPPGDCQYRSSVSNLLASLVAASARLPNLI